MSDHALLAISTVAEVLILLAVLYEAGTTIADRTRAKAAQRGAAAFRRRNPIIVILLIPLTSTVAWVTVSLYGDAAHAALAYTAFVLLLVLASASVVFAIRRFTHRIQEIGFHSTEAPYRREIPLPDKTPQAGFPVSDVRYSLGVRAGSAAVTLEVCLPDDGNDDRVVAVRHLPQPLREESTVTACWRRLWYRERLFDIAHRINGTADSAWIYLGYTQRDIPTEVPVGPPLKRYLLLVRVASEFGTVDRWLSMTVNDGGAFLMSLAASPDFRVVDPALLTEFEGLVSQVNAQMVPVSSDPQAHIEAFRLTAKALNDRFDETPSRLDRVSRERLRAYICATNKAHWSFADEVLALDPHERTRAHNEALAAIFALPSYREGLVQWFAVARRLIAEARVASEQRG